MRLFVGLLRLGGAMMDRLIKAALLLAILAGIPYGMLTQIGSPLPHRLPTVDQIGHALTAPVSDTIVLNLLALALWVLWAAFVVSFVVEVISVIRGVPRPRLGPIAPLQTLAGWLVAGVTAGVLIAAPVLTVAGHAAPATASVSTPARTAPAASAPATHVPAATSIVLAAGPARSTVDTTHDGLTSAVTSTHRKPATKLPVYQVERGDWLGGIAERYLGDFDRYPEIRDLNPDLITDRTGIHGPDHIEPTWRLILPADAHDRGPQRHATGHLVVTPHTPANPNPDPDTDGSGPCPATPTTPATPTPSATATTPATPTPSTPGPSASSMDSDGVITQPGTATTSAPDPSASSPTQSPRAAPDADATAPADRDRSVGVHLPGGWVSIPFAAALVAAAGMVWLRRRHRYVPKPLNARSSDDTLDDPDLRPLPPVVPRLRRAVREQAPDLLHPPAAGQPTVAEYTSSDAGERAELPPIGPSGLDLAGVRDRVPVGGLGLVGPGAEPAARALLAATLSSGSSADPDARGQVVIPADALTTLLGAQAVHVGPIPRLLVTATLSEALTRVEELLIERRRLLEEYEATGLEQMRAADPFHPPMPPVLLLSETPPTELRARLTTTLHLGSPLQISAVLLGEWPRGDTLTVRSDGHTTGGDRERLAVLDVPTTLQLLAVIQEARTGQPPSTGIEAAETSDGADLVVPAPNISPAPPTPDADNPPPPDQEPMQAATTPPPPADATETGETISDTHVAQAQPSPGATPDDASTADPRRGRRRPVRIRLLGEPTIFDRDGAPVPGLRHHARELLVYLAVHRSGASFSQIMEAFWPTATVPRARERLSTEAGDLRRRIRQAAADKDIQPMVNTGSRYHLDPNLLDIDVWRLIGALRQATATTDPAARITALRHAVEAHTGGLADGYDYDWIEQPREQLRRHGIRARLHLAELLAGTQPRTTADLTVTAAGLDPFNEDLARQAMRALATVGDAAGIRAQLQRLRGALDEIDEEPSGETIALAAQLQRDINTTGRSSQPPSDEPPPADTE
jgi:DNA-binding SARP family transcriptional activator